MVSAVSFYYLFRFTDAECSDRRSVWDFLPQRRFCIPVLP